MTVTPTTSSGARPQGSRESARLLDAEGIVAGYGPGDEVLKGVDLRVDGGEIVAILGPNGAGKSTLVKTIAGLIAPSRGNIVLDGQPIGG